jgi:hypothetical protein
MSFISITFYLYLAAVLIAFYLIPPKWRTSLLVVASVVFYAHFSPYYLIPFIATTLLVFFGGLRLASAQTDRARMFWLMVCLVPVLGALIVFKTLGAFKGVIAPIGISYFTFKLISYLLEVYWNEDQVQRDVLAFAAYSFFAPQMISGPIQRPFDFFPQLKRLREGAVDSEMVNRGMTYILNGLLLKLVIGDHLGAFISIVDQSPRSYSWSLLVISTLCYPLYLFADFAGYTYIAIGIGRLFGIESPPNFNAPFAATNIQQFWQRWHMSLTSWLADYVFMPLRMSTRHLGTFGLVLSIMLNATLIGVWHGFTWTYLVFGVMLGVFLTVTALAKGPVTTALEKTPGLRPIATASGLVITFLHMVALQIVFQSISMQAALLRFRQLFGMVPTGHGTFTDIRFDVSATVPMCMLIAFYVGAGLPGIERLSRPAARFIPNWVIYGVALLLLSLMTTEIGSHFIYGQF